MEVGKMLTTSYQVFLVGLAGGAVLELVHWYNIRRDEHFPTYAASPLYWIVTALMAVVGGVLAVIYFGSQAEPIVTFHVGLSTPLILQKLTTTIANVPGARGGASFVSFFTW
jgi:hypothetical protein